MDRVGTFMCLATIPMALLTLASGVAGVVLIATGHGAPIIFGLGAFAACWVLAPALEWIIIRLDDAAARTLDQRGRSAANWIAMACGALPVLVIFGWEIFCFSRLNQNRDGAPPPLVWLWSYGVATGPWTLFALRVSRFRRTLVGIRAYAGHLAYWLLSLLVLAAEAPSPVAVLAMALPAILPVTVGMLLAVADRQALTNVRV